MVLIASFYAFDENSAIIMLHAVVIYVAIEFKIDM